MNNSLKIFLQAVAIGLATMAIGSATIRIAKPSQEIKPLLLSLFITGFVLFMAIEIFGIHKSFCKSYLKQG